MNGHYSIRTPLIETNSSVFETRSNRSLATSLSKHRYSSTNSLGSQSSLHSISNEIFSTTPEEQDSSLIISLSIHELFDEFLVELKENEYNQVASKIFKSKSYLWINVCDKLYSESLNKSARYNSSIVSFSFLRKQIICEKYPQNFTHFEFFY
jgi:hypothetical protein